MLGPPTARHSPEESPAIAKRKPPSQRPERKLDDTARAIARAREADTAPAGAAEPRSSSSYADPKPLRSRGGKIDGARTRAGGPLPSSSTKQPKKPGA